MPLLDFSYMDMKSAADHLLKEKRNVDLNNYQCVYMHLRNQVTQSNQVMWVIWEHVNMHSSNLVTVNLCVQATNQ